MVMKILSDIPWLDRPRRSTAALVIAGLLLATISNARDASADGTASATHLANAPAGSADACPPLLRHSFAPIQGGPAQSLCQYQGRVVLIVNTASQCGYTRQYEGLESLYKKYRDRGLVVLGFPSNDFGGQEPGSNQQIEEFCRTVYGVQFPMFEKANAARLADNPLYADLVTRTGQSPKWNFHKYLIDRSGQRVSSYPSAVEPRELGAPIEKLLAENPPAGHT